MEPLDNEPLEEPEKELPDEDEEGDNCCFFLRGCFFGAALGSVNVGNDIGAGLDFGTAAGIIVIGGNLGTAATIRVGTAVPLDCTGITPPWKMGKLGTDCPGVMGIILELGYIF